MFGCRILSRKPHSCLNLSMIVPAPGSAGSRIVGWSSTGQLVTLGLVYSSIGAMAKGLALIDVEALVVKDMLLSLKRSMSH